MPVIQALSYPRLGYANVKTYGAVGDGVADDTAAIQAAINAPGGNGGVCFFPPGVYKVTSTLTLLRSTQLWGSGMSSPDVIWGDGTTSRLDFSSVTNSTCILLPGNSCNHVIRDLGITGPIASSAGTSSFGIRDAGYAIDVLVQNVYLSGFYTAVSLAHSRIWNLVGVRSDNSKHCGLLLTEVGMVSTFGCLWQNNAGAGTLPANIKIMGGSFAVCIRDAAVDEGFGTSSCIQISDSDNILVDGSLIHPTHGGYGIRVDGDCTNVRLSNLTVRVFTEIGAAVVKTIELAAGGTGHSLTNVTTTPYGGGGDVDDSATGTVFVNVNGTSKNLGIV